jgi:hypothetical protein
MPPNPLRANNTLLIETRNPREDFNSVGANEIETPSGTGGRRCGRRMDSAVSGRSRGGRSMAHTFESRRQIWRSSSRSSSAWGLWSSKTSHSPRVPQTFLGTDLLESMDFKLESACSSWKRETRGERDLAKEQVWTPCHLRKVMAIPSASSSGSGA